MMARVVTLGCGRKAPLGAYVAAWRAVRAADPSQVYRQGLRGRLGPETAADILRDFRAGMADRINRHDPRYGRGRKWSPDWQRAALQLALAVNTPRLIVRWAPLEFRARLAHRLTLDD